VDSEMNANVKKTVPFGSDVGIWTYIWFGYSLQNSIANGVAKFPDSD
jgi:hypothetical protein